MGTLIVILLLLLFLSGFFSGSEIALFSLKETDILSIKEKNLKNKISKLLDKPSDLLSTILISNNIVNILFANLFGIAIYEISGDKGIILAILIETPIILVFGEIIPKTLATRFNKNFSKFSSIILDYLIQILKPLIFIIHKITKPVIHFILNKIPIEQEFLSKDEILNVLRKDHNQRNEAMEETILLNILNTHLFSLDAVMKKRNETLFINKAADYSRVKNKFQKTNSDFLIVYENDIDNIVGILKINNFYKYKEKWNDGILKPLYLPALKKLRNSISILQEKKIALVVSEYGRVVGTITYKDIMQYIIKNIEIDYDDIIHEKITSNSIIVNSDTTVEYVNRVLNLNLDPAVSRTIGGYLQQLTGKIPDVGETITDNNVKFFVIHSTDKKLDKIKIYKLKDTNV